MTLRFNWSAHTDIQHEAAAALRDAGRPCLKEAAIQTLGSCGYVNDFPLERIYRDVRVCQIYEGTRAAPQR